MFGGRRGLWYIHSGVKRRGSRMVAARKRRRSTSQQSGVRVQTTARRLPEWMVGATGVEPARIAPQDPKSCASANSATRPQTARRTYREIRMRGKLQLGRRDGLTGYATAWMICISHLPEYRTSLSRSCNAPLAALAEAGVTIQSRCFLKSSRVPRNPNCHRDPMMPRPSLPPWNVETAGNSISVSNSSN
jgi:hypothetical protein